MPIDEEQSDVALEISNEAKRMLQGKLVSSGVAGVLSLIPGVGAAVIELMTELAIQRTNNPVNSIHQTHSFNGDWFSQPQVEVDSILPCETCVRVEARNASGRLLRRSDDIEPRSFR